jgi:hypothetical protein
MIRVEISANAHTARSRSTRASVHASARSVVGSIILREIASTLGESAGSDKMGVQAMTSRILGGLFPWLYGRCSGISAIRALLAVSSQGGGSPVTSPVSRARRSASSTLSTTGRTAAPSVER